MSKAKIHYARVDEFWRKEQKHKFLEENQHLGNIEWQEIQPDAKQTWLMEGMNNDFETFISLGSKESKSASSENAKAIFKTYSLGVSTNRDDVVYGFDKENLLKRVERFCDDYNSEVYRYLQKGKPSNIDDFLTYDKIKWSESLKSKLKSCRNADFDLANIRLGYYRPFTKKFLYYDHFINDRPSFFLQVFPSPDVKDENSVICVSDIGSRSPFSVIATNAIPDLHLCASSDGFQCFPFYTYDEDGANRKENITDWALNEFRSHYKDKSIIKWDIFHYVYALLHHPFYRQRYAANLKRELPRIPYAPDFRAFADAGKQLAELHVNYESQKEYALEMIESQEAALDWRVEKMRLTKDKSSIIYNDFLTLSGIPSEAFDYRLGNRSALDWIIDQYQVSTDKRSGITNDPNREDDPQYIVRLIGQIITVSLETMKIVRTLPDLGMEDKPNKE